MDYPNNESEKRLTTYHQQLIDHPVFVALSGIPVVQLLMPVVSCGHGPMQIYTQ